MILLGIAAVLLGATAIVLTAVNIARGKDLRANTVARNIALVVAVAGLFSASWMLYNPVRSDFHQIVSALCGMQIVAALAAIVAWCSRWRVLTEGAATISLAIFAILTGFSIGISFLPVALAMGVAAVAHGISPTAQETGLPGTPGG